MTTQFKVFSHLMLGAINLRISQLGHNTARDSLSLGNLSKKKLAKVMNVFSQAVLFANH
jgi:hypothetical protein